MKYELDGIYNLGTGRKMSFNELIDMLNEELGTDTEPGYSENPISDDVYVHDTMGDYSGMKNETGWEQIISLKDGITDICNQYIHK